MPKKVKARATAQAYADAAPDDAPARAETAPYGAVGHENQN